MTLVLLLLACPALARGDELCFTPFVNVREEYNSNIVLDTNAGNVKKDYITTLSPGFEMTDSTERLDSLLSLRLDRLQYSRYEASSATNQQYSGSVKYAVTELLKVSAQAGYQKTANPSLDWWSAAGATAGPPSTTSWNPNSVTISPNAGSGGTGGTAVSNSIFPLVAVPVQSTSYGLSTDYQLTEKTALSAQYQYGSNFYEYGSNSSVEPQYRDIAHDALASLITDFSKYLPRLKGRFIADYDQYLLPDSRTINATGTIGFSYDVNETWNIMFDGGLRHTDYETFVNTYVPSNDNADYLNLVSERQNYAEWGRVGYLTFTYKDEYLNANLMYSKNLDLASGLNAVTERDAYSLTSQYRITYELTASLTAGYSTYRSDTANAVLEQKIDVLPAVRYDFSKDWALEASYENTRIDYPAANAMAKRELYFIRLSTRFPYCSSRQYK